MRRTVHRLLLGTAISLPAAIADAHVDIDSGPGFARTTQEISFAVGHGCAGLDTSSVRIEIPANVATVRTETSDFGKATVEKDATGAVKAVIWQKPDADLLPGDTAFYRLFLRVSVPNEPFTSIYFPTHQTCKGEDGGTVTTDWTATTSDAGGEPAPQLLVLPARQAGWNKYTVPIAISDLKKYFSDALIVWKDNAAYSSNPNTTALIGTTSGVSALASLAANDEVWVKY